MSHNYGRNLGGIRAIDDILARCHVDEITGCWHWRMSTDHKGHPSLWLPDLRIRTTIGVAIGYLLTGSKPTHRWHCTCETKRCANPAHREPGDQRAVMRAARIKPTPIHKARIAMTKRKASKLSDEAADEIRASDETLETLAKRHGISITQAGRIRRGMSRRPLVTGASIFTMGAQP